MSAVTTSGDYRLPGLLRQAFLNRALSIAAICPSVLSRRFLNRHAYYQVLPGHASADSQGDPAQKWLAMAMPDDLSAQTVLDIGCAEGFFSLECASRGAREVVGIDSRFGALLCARLLARQKGLRAVFRVGVFPDSLLRQSYDIVICLSVLHHMVSTKDIWKVLSSDAFHADLKAMRQYLKELRALVKRGGRCIIEMPYEYSDGASRSSVKFQRFNDELVLAGFSRSQTLGVWAHAARNQKRKDRVLYSAVA